MTDSVTSDANSVGLEFDDGVELAPYAKDYWDIVFEQIGKRLLVKAAIAVLALLYASAIYAPLLASDRPFVLSAVDEKAYDSARKSIVGIVNTVGERAEEGREVYATKDRNLSFDESLDSQLGALRLRIATLSDYLPSDKQSEVESFESRFDELVTATRDGAAGASDQARSLSDEARALRKSLVASADGSKGFRLEPVRSYPLFESITWVEAFFMALWAMLLTWPIWNRLWNRRYRGDRERIRKARKRKLWSVLAIASACGCLWAVLVGGSMTFEASVYKDRLDAGTITPESIVFPPLALGFAETHVEEPFRPPTWTKKSTINEEGAYLFGPRKPAPDPITGRIPVSTPVEVRYGEPGRNGAFRHFLGTDGLGRDIFVRMLYGGRISLSVGILSTILLLLIGVTIGAIAGYFGGWVDLVLSRIIEIVQSIPAFFLILTAVALVPSEFLHPIFAIVIVIALVRWTGIARLVRGEFLKLKDQDFVVAARAGGLSPARVIFRHVLPNALGPVLVAAAFSVAAGILTESAISFLGFGVQHPIPSWGSVLNASKASEHWWIQVFPGVLIFVTVFCYNIVGEGLRDALDPRMKA